MEHPDFIGGKRSAPYACVRYCRVRVIYAVIVIESDVSPKRKPVERIYTWRWRSKFRGYQNAVEIQSISGVVEDGGNRIKFRSIESRVVIRFAVRVSSNYASDSVRSSIVVVSDKPASSYGTVRKLVHYQVHRR